MADTDPAVAVFPDGSELQLAGLLHGDILEKNMRGSKKPAGKAAKDGEEKSERGQEKDVSLTVMTREHPFFGTMKISSKKDVNKERYAIITSTERKNVCQIAAQSVQNLEQGHDVMKAVLSKLLNDTFIKDKADIYDLRDKEAKRITGREANAKAKAKGKSMAKGKAVDKTKKDKKDDAGEDDDNDADKGDDQVGEDEGQEEEEHEDDPIVKGEEEKAEGKKKSDEKVKHKKEKTKRKKTKKSKKEEKKGKKASRKKATGKKDESKEKGENEKGSELMKKPASKTKTKKIKAPDEKKDAKSKKQSKLRADSEEDGGPCDDSGDESVAMSSISITSSSSDSS